MVRLLSVLLASVTLVSGAEQQECDSDSLSALQTPTLLAAGRSGGAVPNTEEDETAAAAPGGSSGDLAQPAAVEKAWQNGTLEDFKAALDALAVEPIRSEEDVEDALDASGEKGDAVNGDDVDGVNDWSRRRYDFPPRRRYGGDGRRRDYDDSRRRDDGRRRYDDDRRRRGDNHGVVGETCCMCSHGLAHLGTLLYAADDYAHNYGSHNARWHCMQVCEHQCDWMGAGRMLGCYDERHIIQVNNRYAHRHGWNIWQESHGNIC